MEGGNPPCSSRGYIDNEWNKATAATPVPTSLVRSQNVTRVPKVIDGHKLLLWSSRIQAFLTARDLIGTFDPTSYPSRAAGGLGGMAERDRLMSRYGPEKVEKCENSWELLKEAMQGQPVEERMHETGSAEGA